MDNQRNLMLSVLLMGLVLIGWNEAVRYFYPEPTKPVAAVVAAPSKAPAKPTREGGLQSPEEASAEQADLARVFAAGHRVTIDAPELKGSLNLVGAVLDDVTLAHQRETIAKDSPQVRLFSPLGTPAQQFAQIGWVGRNGIQAPDGQTLWQADRTVLSPTSPVTLSWTNPTGQTFSLRYAIDANYMLTITQSVRNDSGTAAALQRFALINRTDRTASLDTWQIHSGPIGAFDGVVSFANHYKDLATAGLINSPPAVNWIGFTDVYWMSVLIPDQAAPPASDLRALGNDIFRADLIWPTVTLAPHQTQSQTVRLFVGAKENRVLESYEAQGIANLSLAIDWGWFRWFEKPIFWLLDSLFHGINNFGVAIILLTILVRGMMFPIAQRQFASMAAMRALQPRMKELQERYKDDKQLQQQELMALYKREGVNPLAGCLPTFLQIPVFFALYKVLTLTIEMRHQPFVLWIRDLSAPDPLHVLNLFGLLPFEPPAFLGIGVLALLLGCTMWAQFKLQPATMDPAQQQVMSLMPWMMMFVMAPFAAGLLIYWITSNLLTIAQQRYLYSRHPQLKAQSAAGAVIEQPAVPASPAPKGPVRPDKKR